MQPLPARRCLGNPASGVRIAVLAVMIGFGLTAARAQDAGAANASAANGTGTVSQPMFDYFRNNLSPYEPIYFISGTAPQVEFQFSVMYRILADYGYENPLSHWFAYYTQTSFWTLFSSNPYFYDSSYKPGTCFYYRDLERYFRLADSLRLQAGFEHESNGRGGSGERSVQTVYVQPTASYYLSAKKNLWITFQPRFWWYESRNPQNADIADYRGYGEMRVALSGNAFQVESTTEVGRADGRISEQVDVRYQLPKWVQLHMAAQLQYFSGYGETLRDYDLSIRGFRAGICIWYDSFKPTS